MWLRDRKSSSDRDGSGLLSSGVHRLTTMFLIAGCGLALSGATLDSQQRDYYRARLRLASPVALQTPPQGDALAEAIVTWDSLRQSDNLPFESYAGFLVQHAGWPGESALRRSAERAIRADQTASSSIISYFYRYPPVSVTGRLRYAEALLATGRRQDAVDQARKAWAAGSGLSSDDENRLLGRFGSELRAEDHDARMDALLWKRQASAAMRELPFTSPARQPYFRARLALQTRAADAAQQLAAIWPANANNPGLIADKAFWQRDTGDWAGARQTMANARVAPGSASDALAWMNANLQFARAAANDSQWSIAYAIANDSNPYPAGTVLRDRSDEERDVFTSLEWLAGWTALKPLGRPADAVTHFERYSLSAQTPQTQSKGDYWAGRAADAAGQKALARSFYEKAAVHPDHFYGQLALERLGRRISPPASPQVQITAADRARFDRDELVRAARMLGELGDTQRQSSFIHALAARTDDERDLVMTAALSTELDRPDLGVRLARNARRADQGWLWNAGYPKLSVPSILGRQWTMIHAIARQESEFNKRAVSHANARGLMQLLPGTASETARKMGMAYDYQRLTDDAVYNVTLGSTYFANLLDQFGTSYVLAVAAYNAGPGNVRKWIAANGDPRLPGVDVIEWIEMIPYLETRDYVQRVLENAVMYDTLNPTRATMAAGDRLSAYLGKKQPG